MADPLVVLPGPAAVAGPRSRVGVTHRFPLPPLPRRRYPPPVDTFAQRLEASLRNHGLLPPDGGLVVAVSGGLDSMTLLHGLQGLAGSLGLRLVVAHADHQLRGRASAMDARSVVRTAASLGIPCVQTRLPVTAALAASSDSAEMAARDLRHQFLASVAVNHGISTVAVAHHADDRAELVLLRLLRGAGSDGLGAMSWSNPSPADPGVRLIRPLLAFSRKELESIARRHGIRHREDASNRDPAILRNRIRCTLIPWLEREFSPSIRNLLFRTADLLGADAAFVQSEAERWLRSKTPPPFDGLPIALQRAVLRLQMRRAGHPVGFESIERLRIAGAVEEVAPGIRFEREPSGRVRPRTATTLPAFKEKTLWMPLEAPTGGASLANTRIEYRHTRRRTRRPPGPRIQAESFDADRVGSGVLLRHWRPGDRFQPLGFPRPAKLQDLLVNRKVPVARRRQLVVATTRDDVVFWVESLPPGEAFKVTPATRRLLLWKWRVAP